MNKLVIRHTYAHGMTFDVSGERNHGVPVAIASGGGLFANSFLCNAGDSRMQVGPSESLQDLGQIRTRIRFFHTPTAGGGRRHNLIEGHLSFALFINPGRSLSGTILTADNNWRGAKSPAGLVAPNRWHEAEFRHDGFGHSEIYLDGALVAPGFDARGPVRSVGANGVAIGHWPEPSPVYTFEGYIGETELYKYDPKGELEQLLDGCCMDRDALEAVRARLRDEGWNARKLCDQAKNLLHLGTEVGSAMRKGDPIETEEHKRNCTEAMTAFLHRDAVGFRAAFGRMVAQASRNLHKAQIEDFGLRVHEAIDKMPLSVEEFVKLAEAICWKDLIIRDAEELARKNFQQP